MKKGRHAESVAEYALIKRFESQRCIIAKYVQSVIFLIFLTMSHIFFSLFLKYAIFCRIFISPFLE
jgi:hypothetical protein